MSKEQRAMGRVLSSALESRGRRDIFTTTPSAYAATPSPTKGNLDRNGDAVKSPSDQKGCRAYARQGSRCMDCERSAVRASLRQIQL